MNNISFQTQEDPKAIVQHSISRPRSNTRPILILQNIARSSLAYNQRFPCHYTFKPSYDNRRTKDKSDSGAVIERRSLGPKVPSSSPVSSGVKISDLPTHRREKWCSTQEADIESDLYKLQVVVTIDVK